MSFQPVSVRLILPLLLFLLVVLLIVPVTGAAAPTVTGITPSSGANTTTVSITNLAGTGFQSGANITLTPVNVTPVHKGSIADSAGGAKLSNPYSVYVAGNYAYVASADSNALEIVDISNPASPTHKASITDGTGTALLSNPHSVYVSGNYAYVASYGSNALEIVDITDPASPTHKGKILNGDGGANLIGPYGVYIAGNYAYVTSRDGNALEIVNITDPASPTHKGKILNGDGGANLVGPYKVSVSGNYAYVTSRDGNALEIVNITDPANPTHKGKILNGDGGAKLTEPYGVYVAGNYTYVASCASNALEIVDITDPASPTHKASISDGTGTALLSCPLGVYVVGNYAYVASTGSSALEIVNITDPASPTHKASISDGTGTALLSNPISVYVSGIYVYVASSGSNALEIVDIGNIPLTGASVVSASKITGTFDLTGRIAGLYHVVAVNPDNQYGTLSNGFTIWNGTAPAPTVTGITPSSGQNTTTVSITNLAGTGFSGTPAVNLTRVGYSNITATAVTLVSANQLTCTFDLTNKIPGTWTVNVTNPDGQQGVLLNGFTITNTTPAPTVTGITPSSGQNTTTVSITNLAGTGFSGTPAVNLTRAGYSNITATAVTLVSANQLTCTFDLTNKIAGTWNVNVTNPDGQQGVLLNGFTITNTSDPTPTPSPTPGPTPTSSGGDNPANIQKQGSGSGAGVSTASGAAAGQTVTYSFGEPSQNSPVVIESITFVPDQTVGQSQCLVSQVTPAEAFSIPDRPAVYESIQINWINPGVMTDINIQFSVKGSWIREQNVDPKDIVMMRQHDLAWAEIPTVFDHVANDIYYYRSITPGFSNFAVSVRKKATVSAVSGAAPVPEPYPPVIGTTALTADAGSTPSVTPVRPAATTPVPLPAPATEPETGIPVLFIAAGIAIIILAVAGFFIGRRRRWARQNPGLFRKYRDL